MGRGGGGGGKSGGGKSGGGGGGGGGAGAAAQDRFAAELAQSDGTAGAARAAEVGRANLAVAHPLDRSPAAYADDILSAYGKVAPGPNSRVQIADLRLANPQLTRSQFDAGLARAISSGRASAYRLDHPGEVTPRRAAAAWRTPTGEARHIVYAGGRSG